MPFIVNLNPSDPATSENAGGAAQELKDLKQTLQDQFVNFEAAAVTLTVAEINALDPNLDALAAEVGFNFSSPSDPTRIDTIDTECARTADDEDITGQWVFNGGAVTFVATPTVGGTAVAVLTDIPTRRETNQVAIKGKSVDYTLIDSDFENQRKIRYDGSGDATFTVPAAQDGDLVFITNASPDVLTVTGSGVTFRNRYGQNLSSFTITGRWKTVGLHQINSTSFEISGDYD